MGKEEIKKEGKGYTLMHVYFFQSVSHKDLEAFLQFLLNLKYYYNLYHRDQNQIELEQELEWLEKKKKRIKNK